MNIPVFDSRSRLMLIAPHPDDESLACGIALQRAALAGALIRVVYATDGDDNPWPQRALERKWRLDAADRKRWGKLRRAEALAALRVLGVHAADVCFVGLPDQKLTALLMGDCEPIIERFAAIIPEFDPTHLLVPSIADTHPDHSALAVMLHLVLAKLPLTETEAHAWSYVVHGNSSAFLHCARQLRQSEIEEAIKLSAIRCHKTQIKLSGRRFLAYAARPERFLKFPPPKAIIVDGSIVSVLRDNGMLRIKFRLPVKPIRGGEPALFALGYDEAGKLHCLKTQIPVRSGCAYLFRVGATEPLSVAQFHGNNFAGELEIPFALFSPTDALFVKLERRAWFFDEAGWIEIPAATPVSAPQRELARLLEIR